MSIEDFYWSFTFKQIVLVNSGKYCYVKVPLNEHICLLGANNGGKTSILNSLKFFLLPEENLHDCAKKFGLRNSTGFYSRESTYQFYFPGRSSFVILEAENPHGTFCIVLNQGNKPFSYERTGVPCAYNEIEHLFWNVHSPINGGQGAPVPGLSVQGISAALKGKGGVLIRDINAIKERIYKHNPTRPEIGRFCLLPLKSGGAKQREVDAWKRLIHLSFDIGAKDRRTLPDTIATIIEGRKARTEAEVNINFGEIMERYQGLRATENRLQTIKNGERYWSAFDRGFIEVEARAGNLLNQLLDAESSIEEVKAQLLDVRAQRTLEYTQRNDHYRELEKQSAALVAEYNHCRGVVSSAKRFLDQIHKEAIDLGAARAGYAGKSLPDILQIRLDTLEETKLDLTTLEDKAKLHAEFESVNRQVKQLRQLQEDTDLWIKNSTSTVLDHIDSDKANLLFSLNQSVFSVECDSLESGTKSVIEQFAGLMCADDGALKFLGRQTGITIQRYSAAELLANKQEELRSITSQLLKTEARYRELSSRVTQTEDQLAVQRKKLLDDISRDEYEIGLLKRAEHIETELRRRTEEHEQASSSLSLLEAQCQEANTKHQDARSQRDEASRALEQAKRDSEDVIRWATKINDLLHSRMIMFRAGHARGEPQHMAVSQQVIDDMDQRCRDLGTSLHDLCRHVSDLLDAVPIDDSSSDQAHRAVYELSDLRQIHDRYALLYARLAADEDMHFNQVVAHNHDTDIQMRQIASTRTLINGFIREIEDHLKSVRISNIEEIRIDCNLHPQFDELLNVLESVNMTGGELPPDVLYERLGSFFSQFFESENRRDSSLNMAKLISSVEYSVRLQGKSEFQVEAQSTGTSVMINIRVLAFLLKQLLQNDSRVSMPLLIDEIAQLDVDNLKSARDIANADGFSIFAATPSWTPAVGKVLGKFMNLSHFVANEESYSAERTILYTGVSESISQRDDLAAGHNAAQERVDGA